MRVREQWFPGMQRASWLLLTWFFVACQHKAPPAPSSEKSAVTPTSPSASSVPSAVDPIIATADTLVTSGEACESAISLLVNALPEVKSELAKAQRDVDRSHGRARFGGIGPNDDDGGFIASIGIHTDDQFEPRVTYQFDHTGALSVTVQGEELRLSPSTLKEARGACTQ